MRVATRVARATLVQVASKALGAAIGLVVLGVAARHLHGEGLGHYATVLAYVGFLAVLSDLGLGQLAARELATGDRDRSVTLGNLLGLRVTASLLILGLGAVGAQFLPLEAAVKSGIWTGAIAFGIAAISQVFVALYQVRISMGLVASAELVGRFVLLGVVLESFRQGWGLQGILVGHVAANGTNLAILGYATRKFTRVAPRVDRTEWGRLIEEAWPIALSLVMFFLYSKADILVLSLFKPAQVVGLYAAGYKIIEVVVQVPAMFAGLIVPLLSFAHGTPEGAKAIFQRAFDVLSLFAIGIMVGGLILADPIVRLVNGDAFAPAATSFRVLILATGMLSLSLLPSFAVVAFRKQRAMLWVYLLVGALGLALYVTLIPPLSALGAAIGTLVTEAVFAAIGYALVLRWTGIRLRFDVPARGLVASAVLAIALAVTPHWHLFLRLAVGGCAYVGALVLLGAVHWSVVAEVLSISGSGRTPTEP